MRNDPSSNTDAELLYRAILNLKDMEECRSFFETLCTMQEIRSFAQRINVAKMLTDNCVYNQIMKQTGASTATISRVNRALNYGDNGFNSIFERMVNDD